MRTHRIGSRGAALLLAIAACYTAGPPPLVEETIADRMSWVDVSLVPRSFRRLGTMPYVGPYFILVSQSGHYCVVSDAVFAAARTRERWACNWQTRRPT